MNELLITRLRTARINKNMKQQDVADILGIKPNTLSNWEKGRTEPDIDTFVKLCDIYEIDCASLLADVYAFKRVQTDISLPEYEMIKRYRDLDGHGKKMVDFTLENEWKRSIMSKDLDGQITLLDILPNAAHERTDIKVTAEMRKHDDDIMDDENF